jgi:hypothetical protein
MASYHSLPHCATSETEKRLICTDFVDVASHLFLVAAGLRFIYSHVKCISNRAEERTFSCLCSVTSATKE